MKDHTKIVCVLDRSGSMLSIIDDSIGGFNLFLQRQQELGDNADISVYLFNDDYQPLVENVPIREMKPLTSKEYSPRKMTALYDALAKTINAVGAFLTNISEENRPDKVLFVILTDGQENSSKEFTKDAVLEMVSHQREKYNWQFMYLAASEAGLQDGRAIGMKAKNSVQFSADSKGTQRAYRVIDYSVANYRNSDKFILNK